MTGFSNTSRTQYRYAVETTQNTIPAIAFQNITGKSGSLEANQTDVTSMGIRSDRTVQDQLLASRVPGGQLTFELAYGIADPIIAATLQDTNTWNAPTTYSNTAVSTASSVFQYTASVGTSGAPIGALLLSSGFTNAVNNGVMVVTSQTSDYITFSSSGSVPVTEATSAAHSNKVIGCQGTSNGEITIGATSINSAVTNFLLLPLTAYQVIKVGGAATSNKSVTAANNDFVRITAISSYSLTLDNLPSGWTTDSCTAVQLRLTWGDYIANGNTRTSFTIEEDHPDISFTRDFTGMYPDQLQLTMKPGQILEAQTTWKGMGITTGTSSATTGAALATNTNPLMNAVKSIVRINVDGTPAGKMSDGTILVKNNLGDVPALGVLGNADVRDGQFNAEFSFSMYMSSTQGQSLYADHLADTARALWFALKDSSSNAYVIDLPSGKFISATTPVPGISQDYKGTFKHATRYDPNSTKQMMMNRIPYYAV